MIEPIYVWIEKGHVKYLVEIKTDKIITIITCEDFAEIFISYATLTIRNQRIPFMDSRSAQIWIEDYFLGMWNNKIQINSKHQVSNCLF